MSAVPTRNSELKKVLILALGGEGGGTLTEWVVEAGVACGWPIQATSIPGVAQRTGATSYYIECLPRCLAAHEASPPMCLAPLAGDVDLIVSSEWLETARAVERGLASPARTVIVSSTARSLTTEERVHPTDGRFDDLAIEAATRAACATLHMADLTALALANSTAVSAVMFGALVASGVLPFDLAVCQRVVRGDAPDSPRSKASWQGFLAGWQAVAGAPAKAAPSPATSHAPSRDPENASATVVIRGIALPAPVAAVAQHGVVRLVDHQDSAYADQYLGLVQRFAAADTAPYAASTEAARTLALWMAYEDVIRVADLKSRASRFAQIRRDYGAQAHEPVVVRDFLKPGLAEMADILPPAPARWLRAVADRRLQRTGAATLGDGIQLQTSSVLGLLAMRLMASLRPLRRRSARFAEEQALVTRWTAALEAAWKLDEALARQVATLPRLIKGYSDTHARGKAKFLHILDTLIEPALQTGDASITPKVARAMEAATRHASEHELLEVLGLPKPAPREQVVHLVRPSFMRPKVGAPRSTHPTP
jgi:indolepyruvate ferredoxin oxidoreductase beta subunit